MKKLLFVGPVLTASGYGEHSRQILNAILKSEKFDVSINSIRWGSTPFILEEDRKIHSLIKKYEVESNSRSAKYDASVQVTIPNEFKKLADINIGVTAGIEVDRVSPDWIDKTNEMLDLLVVPSKHSANTFASVIYKNSNNEELRLKCPILISPEGFDVHAFNRKECKSYFFEPDMDFNFLSVGLGLDQKGEDRKNTASLIKLFCESFAGERVGLLLKMGMVGNSLMDFETCKNIVDMLKKSTGCGEYPKIQLIHGRLTKNQMASLYKHPKIKAYVSTTHGEGFGLPMLEASACGLPVMATNWSGHLDFLSIGDKRRFIPFDFEMKEVADSSLWKGVIEKGTKWAEVNKEDVKFKLRKFYLNSNKPKEWAEELADYLATYANEERLGKRLVDTIYDFVNKKSGISFNEKVNNKKVIYEQLGLSLDNLTLLFTMPMSAGDVFISTAIVDSLKKKFPDHHIIFATADKYRDILKNNPDIYKVVHIENWMSDISFCEKIFDEVYTPNLAIQLTTSNWVHGGKGRILGQEMATQCCVDFGEYKIEEQKIDDLPDKYITLHPGSGKGQHEARNYRHWKTIVYNINRLMPDYKIVVVGQSEDMFYDDCVDYRGSTTYNQLAYIIKRSSCHIGIDSLPMHLAASFDVPCVAIFGSSHSHSTGPISRKVRCVAVEADRPSCKKACYKYSCVVDKEYPCINNIDPATIFNELSNILKVDDVMDKFEYVKPKIAGYTHVLNAESHGFPYIESIKSMLGFCDEVIVVDGGSNDGTIEKIRSIGDDRIKLFERKWDWEEPGMDGMQKAFGRAMTSVGSDDFLWQQDSDEIVHEDDYEKIRKLAERFPSDVDVIHLPVVELWGKKDNVRTDRHSWKWRMSRNNFMVTHGINKNARLIDPKTGKTYAKKGRSDGCEYIDIMTGDFLPHKGFYTNEIEQVRLSDPVAYGNKMNEIFNELPSVFHYSWASIERKIGNFKQFWNKCWSNLYNDNKPEDRFPDVDVNDYDSLHSKSKELLKQGGEHSVSKTFKLERDNPKIMKKWLTVYCSGE